MPTVTFAAQVVIEEGLMGVEQLAGGRCPEVLLCPCLVFLPAAA